MINFSFNKSDSKIRIKEVVLSQIMIFIMLGAISIPFAIYFIIVGHLFDSEFLINGYSALFIAIFMATISIFNYSKIKKDINNSYTYEVMNYTIEKKDGKFIYKNVEADKMLEFTKQDISRIYYTNNLIILKLRNKVIIDFPKQQNITDLFKNKELF